MQNAPAGSQIRNLNLVFHMHSCKIKFGDGRPGNEAKHQLIPIFSAMHVTQAQANQRNKKCDYSHFPHRAVDKFFGMGVL